MTIPNPADNPDETPAPLARERYTPAEDIARDVRDHAAGQEVVGDPVPGPMPVAALGEVVVGGWHDETAARAFHQAHKLEGAKAVAIVRRDDDGTLHIDDYDDNKVATGAAIGGAIGGAIGLIFGPLAIATGAFGAAIGGLVNLVVDDGFSDDALKAVGNTLGPNTSAYIAVIEPEHAEAAKQALTDAGAQVSSNLRSQTLALLASLDESGQ